MTHDIRALAQAELVSKGRDGGGARVGWPVTKATPTLPRSVLVRSRVLACAVPRFLIGAVLERARA
jgi:hypothetical protein